MTLEDLIRLMEEVPIEIKLTNKQKEKVGHNKLCPTPNERGDYSELVVMKVLKELKCEPEKIKGEDNMKYGDIGITHRNTKDYDKYWRAIEVKSGTYFDNKYKACIDVAYTKKGSNGRKRYEQKKGLSEPWLYHESYDILAVVFYDRIYFFEAYPFLDRVIDSIWFKKCQYPKQRGMYAEWYGAKYRHFIDFGVEGSIKSPEYWKAETYLANIDLDLFLRLHHIPYEVIKYRISE